MALLSTFVLNAHPAYLQGNLLGLKKDQISNKGGPFLWIFQFYIGFTFFEVSAPFGLFRFLDPWILNTHLRSSSPNQLQQLGSYPTTVSEIADEPSSFTDLRVGE